MILGKLIIPNVAVAGTLKNSLISCWEFEETSGTTLYDANGNFNFTLNGASLNQDAGKLGKSVYFDGINDYLSLSSTTLGISSSNTITLSYWIKPIGISADAGVLLNTYDRNSVKGRITSLGALSGSQAKFIVTNIYTTGVRRDRQSSLKNVNTWYHVVFIIYPNTTLPDIYIDNALDNATNSSIGTPTQLYFGGYNATLGRESYRTSPTGWLKGYISQAAIWSRKLTTSEISSLYNSGNGLTYLNW